MSKKCTLALVFNVLTVICSIIGFILMNIVYKKHLKSSKEQANKIIEQAKIDADNCRKSSILEAKEEIQGIFG